MIKELLEKYNKMLGGGKKKKKAKKKEEKAEELSLDELSK